MTISRRSTLLLGASALAGLSMRPRAGQAQTADTYAIEGGELTIHPVEHASLVMTMPGMVISPGRRYRAPKTTRTIRARSQGKMAS